MNKNKQLSYGTAIRKMLIFIGLFVFIGCRYSVAATFDLQATTVLLEEKEKTVTFRVTNTSSQPILLVTTLDELPTAKNKIIDRIVVTPIVARVEPKQSQFIRFDLLNDTPLTQDYMLAVSFEGVEQKTKGKAILPISQKIGFLIEAQKVGRDKKPWDDLKWNITDSKLTLFNEGEQVIRLASGLVLYPLGEVVILDRLYILPKTELLIPVTKKGVVESIEITPLSRYGIILPKVNLSNVKE